MTGDSPRLTDPIRLAGRTAPARVIFGPHETNLGRRRELTERHVAYYRRRAAGGSGVVVVETASVTADDHPYERAPLAELCEPGWAAIAEACAPYGTLVLAGLGHAGGQGSSAFSQSVLWAPSPVPDAVTREMPAEMEQEQIDAVMAAFADAARRAARAGLDGVEIDAGAVSLLRQFHSGLTNLRGDAYGEDRLRLTRQVLAAVREAIGEDRVLSLRLSCDELAPWAGVTPEQAAAQVDALADAVDLLVVVRGGPFSASAYRPDGHTPPGFNLDLCHAMRKAAGGRVPVALQGSVVELGAAQAALDDGAADLVEMTRAQIAEPRLVALARAGMAERARPCVLCNQTCLVRDNRNPIVTCVGEPGSGYETEESFLDEMPVAEAGGPAAAEREVLVVGGGPAAAEREVLVVGGGPAAAEREVLVVGGGPAGLECARVLATLGRTVRVAEKRERAGGALRLSAVGGGARERMGLLADWLEAECRRLGVRIDVGAEVTADDLASAGQVVLATGARPGPQPVCADGSITVVGVRELCERGPAALPEGPVVLDDPVGGPIAVAAAEWLAAEGRQVALITRDGTAGTMLALTGDLADANSRLQRAGVERVLRSRLRALAEGHATVEHVWTSEPRRLPCAVLIDCGFELPEESLYQARPGTPRAGDCVAPRTVLEAVLEGRRRAVELATGGAR
ncbi:FAD-dependent oxidoreductase [Thermopolyspora sp. NPDC052614]|uniref:oxidoreductase n=1 Tax=Thermopolyspora sp. NPDC052614 TaxID=3155682 RepID=UPI0034159C6B